MAPILIGMAVATLLIIGWAYGSLAACVFLTLAPAAALLIFALQHVGNGHPSPPVWILVCVFIIWAIWLPRHLRLRAIAYPDYRVRLPPVKQDISFVKAAGTGVLIIGAVTLLMMPVFLLGRP